MFPFCPLHLENRMTVCMGYPAMTPKWESRKTPQEGGRKSMQRERLKGALIAEMGKSCKAICQQDGVNYTVTYNPVRKPNIDKDNLIRLKLDHPDIYEQYVTISEFRRFSVKADTKAA